MATYQMESVSKQAFLRQARIDLKAKLQQR